MKITFETKELDAIIRGDYSGFDHELSAYELKQAVVQIAETTRFSGIVGELNEKIACQEAEIEELKKKLEYHCTQNWQFRKEKIVLKSTIRGKDDRIIELEARLRSHDLALEEAAAKRDELETKNRQLCNDLAGERLSIRNLEEKLEESRKLADQWFKDAQRNQSERDEWKERYESVMKDLTTEED